MIHIAIVEDDSRQLTLLKKYVEQFSREENKPAFIHTFSDGEEILYDYAPGKYDILLMDICMRFVDGMKTSQIIRETDKNVLILFITNMVQYAVQGYGVQALDFIVKPVSYDTLKRKLLTAFSHIDHRDYSMVRLKTLEGSVYLDRAEILFVETEGRRLKLHTRSGDHLFSGTMQAMEDILSDERFFRVHVGCLINLEYVRSVEKSSVFIGQFEVPISKHRKKEFMDALANYMGKGL